jgi:hypothetical protein
MISARYLPVACSKPLASKRTESVTASISVPFLSTSLIFTFSLFIVMRHLKPSPLEATLHIETFIRLATVQDALVTADFRGNEVERLDDLQSELLALLVFGNSNIFDVTDESEVMNTTCCQEWPIIRSMFHRVTGVVQFLFHN